MTDFRVTDHLLDNDDDEYEGNTTTPFQPDYNSTPGPSGEDISMTTMNRGQEKGSEIAEISFIEGDTSYSRVIT